MEFYCLWKLSSFNELDRAEFARLFGKDLLKVFAGELREFERAGCARVLKDKVLFVKTDIKTRFLIAMLFIGRGKIRSRIDLWLRERRVTLRFREFAYEAFAEYSPDGALSFRALPAPGSRRSALFEGMIGRIFSGIRPGADLETSVLAFETALRRLEASLRRRLGVRGREGRSS